MAQADFIVKNGAVILNGLTATSTSTTTGALVVQGGIATSGRSTFGGPLFITSTETSTSSLTGALVVSGGLGVQGDLFVKGVNLLNYDDHIYYVSDGAGNDSNDGRRLESAFRTIKYALSQVSNGGTIYIESGTYVEEFPLYVPKGVSIRGAGLREVYVQPTTATNTSSAFLLDGETTISDFTVGGFYKPGYAFEYANSATITTRSPYVERFSVITRGSNTTASDPYGFDSNDAGGGAYLDGSKVSANSIEAAFLFNEATFIVPSSTAVYMTNGTRVELLNGFSYFADKGLVAESGAVGWGGQGRTRLRLANSTGTFTVGHNLNYVSSTGTLVAAGIIDEVTPEYIWLQGKPSGFIEAQDRTGKSVNVYGNAALSSFQRKFGTASVRFTTDGDLLDVVSDTDLQYGLSSYTLDAWVYLDQRNREQYIFNKGTTAATQLGLYIDAANKITGQHGTTIFTATTVLSTGTWYHVMMSRDSSNNNRLFVNGTLEATTTASGSVSNAESLTIGGYSTDPTVSLRGYIDEIRVSSNCRFTSSFTVPTASYNSDVGTTILLHADGADGSVNITDDGLGSQNVYTTIGTWTNTPVASAQQISLADYRQFGAELRSIGSAVCYGNYGIYADGEGIDLKAIAFNMSYIGSGKDFSNDPSLAVQANEIVRLNGAKVYYQTVDHLGDFRVGPEFRINQRTGNVDFGTANFKLGPLSSLTISDGVNTSVLQPTSIQVGQLLFGSNRIQTISGNLIIDPAGSLTTIESDLQVNGGLNFTGQFLATSVANSTSTTTGAIVVSGGVGVAKDIYVGGNATIVGDLIVLGQQTTVATTATSLTDPVIDLGVGPNNGPVLFQDGFDRGILFNYSTTASSNVDWFTRSFFGMDGLTEELIFKKAVSVGSTATLAPDFNALGDWGTARFGSLNLQDTTNATSRTSGSLISLGGAGFAKDVWADRFFDQNGQILSTGSIATFAVASILAGTDTAVSTATGPVIIWNTSTLETVTSRGSTTTSAISITNTTTSIDTSTGALTVVGGVGIGGDLNVGGSVRANALYSDGSLVVTEGTIGSLGVTALYAGTDTAVSSSTGLVTVWNTSTLQTITDRGFTTTNAINITNASSGTTNTGALVVAGGVSVAGDIYSNGLRVLTTETDTLESVTLRGNSTTNAVLFANTSDSSLINDGSVRIYGGAKIDKRLYITSSTTIGTGFTGAIDGRSPLTVNGAEFLQSWYDVVGGVIDFKWVTTSTGSFGGNFALLPVNDQPLSLGPNEVIYVQGGAVNNFVGINTSTPTVALDVAGDIAAYNIYSNGSQVLTNATLGSYGVTSLNTTTGGGISLSTTTGAIIIQSIDDLETVVSRGNISSTAIKIVNATMSTDNTSGALIVTGGVGIAGGMNVGNTATFNDIAVDGISRIRNSTDSTDTNSGALLVTGGVGVTGAIHGTAIFDQGQRVVTSVNPNAGPGITISNEIGVGTATSFTINNSGVIALVGSTYIGINTATGIVTLTNLGVQTLTAGTDTVVSTATGQITVWNNSTLDSVAGRGNSSTYAINITNIQDTNTSTQGALTVAGGVGIAKSLVVGGNAAIHGNLQVFGQQTYVESTQTYIVDPVIELGAGDDNTVLTVNDGYDRGLILNYNPSLTPDPTAANHAFIGMDNDSQILVYKTDVYPGGTQEFSPSFSNTGTWGLAKFGGLTLANTTSATNTTSGVLQVAGGVGIGGTVYIGEKLYVNGQQVLTSGEGGVGSYVFALFAGTDTAVTANTGTVTVYSTATLQSLTNRSSTTTNAITFANTGNSTSTVTGNAVQVSGGVGVQGDVYVEGNVYSQGGTPLYTPRVTVSITPPTTATNRIGDFWIDPSIGVEYQWIKDGSTYYWIQMFGSL